MDWLLWFIFICFLFFFLKKFLKKSTEKNANCNEGYIEVAARFSPSNTPKDNNDKKNFSPALKRIGLGAVFPQSISSDFFTKNDQLNWVDKIFSGKLDLKKLRVARGEHLECFYEHCYKYFSTKVYEDYPTAFENEPEEISSYYKLLQLCKNEYRIKLEAASSKGNERCVDSWHSWELSLLKSFYLKGIEISDISRIFNRSNASTRTKLVSIGVYNKPNVDDLISRAEQYELFEKVCYLIDVEQSEIRTLERVGGENLKCIYEVLNRF